MARLARALGVALRLAAGSSGFPDYGEPTFAGLSVTCLADGPECGGTVCDWLNLVAFRGGFPSLAATRAFLLERLDTLSDDALQHIRLSSALLDEIKTNITASECEHAPKDTQFRPWNKAIDGMSAPENHKILVDTTGGSQDASGAFTPGGKDGVFVANVHANAPGPERMHHHQLLSIFIHYGFEPCQYGVNPDGSYEPGPPGFETCEQDVTPETPKFLEVFFVGSQWLHANWLLGPMAFPNARNCPHDLAPEHYGERGFMMRIFFPLNETDVYYPPNPNGTRFVV